MNTANDLLRRALEVLEAAGALGFGHPPIGKEIRAYLDAPKDEPVAVPVAWISKWSFRFDESIMSEDGVEIPLYTDPPTNTAPKDDPETDFGMMDEPIYLARRKGLDDFFTCSKDRYEELSVLDLFETKLAYLHPPTKTAPKKPMTEGEEDEVFNSASKYAAWLETENRILREAKKPMTEEEIDEELETNEYYCAGSFAEGVRYAERFHGITDVRE